MTLPITLREEAEADFDAAVNWHQSQRTGLGADFAERVQETLDQIVERPELYPRVFQELRRATVKRFPYLVVYQIEPGRIVVVAIVHGSRDSRIWQERL